MLAHSCLSCFPLVSSLFSTRGNLLTEISYRVMLEITEGLSFSLVFIFQLTHSSSRNLSSAVQLWNFSSLSNSSPVPSCNSTKWWFLLDSFGIQTVFGIFSQCIPKVSPEKQHSLQLHLWFFIDPFCEIFKFLKLTLFTSSQYIYNFMMSDLLPFFFLITIVTVFLTQEKG